MAAVILSASTSKEEEGKGRGRGAETEISECWNHSFKIPSQPPYLSYISLQSVLWTLLSPTMI